MKLSLTQWILGGLGLVIVVLLVFVFLQRGTIRGLRDDVAAHEASLAIYAGAQETNLDTIGKLKAENARWAKVSRADPAATRSALEAIASERDQLQADLDEARRQREVIYVRDPAAREWSNAGMPAALADRLFGPAGSR